MCRDFYESRPTLHGYNEQYAKLTFERIIETHENLWGFWIIGDADELVGYSLVTSYWCNEEGGNDMVLDELYIKPEFQHRGYGSLFLEWLQEHFKGQGVSITLEVLTSNMHACHLYLKEGFSPDGYTTYTKNI